MHRVAVVVVVVFKVMFKKMLMVCVYELKMVCAITDMNDITYMGSFIEEQLMMMNCFYVAVRQ